MQEYSYKAALNTEISLPMTQGPNEWDFRVFSQKYTFGIYFVLAPSAEDTAMNSVLVTVELLFQSTVLRMVEICTGKHSLRA